MGDFYYSAFQIADLLVSSNLLFLVYCLFHLFYFSALFGSLYFLLFVEILTVCIHSSHEFTENLYDYCIFGFIQFSCSVCLTLCDPMNRRTPSLPVHHQLPEFTQTHVHRVSDAIQPSHPLSSPSPPAPNPSQHQSLCQWVNSSHEVVKILEFQF